MSLVSKAHAEPIAPKHPQLIFTKLPSPLPVAVASPPSQLQAIGAMQVPIVWENGRPSIFSMLVVPGLAWPILFGQNHLRKTQAHTNHAALQVYFADPQLNFTVTCRDAIHLMRLRFQHLWLPPVPMLFACLLLCPPPPTMAPTFGFAVASI